MNMIFYSILLTDKAFFSILGIEKFFFFITEIIRNDLLGLFIMFLDISVANVQVFRFLEPLCCNML